MTTAGDIVNAALEDVGVLAVGQTALAEDMNGGLVRLNRMIGQFNRRRWLIFHLVDVICQTTGDESYTIGQGAQLNVPRPDKIENGCFFRQFVSGPAGAAFNDDFNDDFVHEQTSNGFSVDYPLTILESREDYNKIALKAMQSWPSFIYYDAAYTLRTPIAGGSVQYPCGNIIINPVPTPGQFELHILVKDVLNTFAVPSTELVLPPEYEEALEYNLALRLCAKYQIEVPVAVAGLARAALATIRSANSQVPLLQLPGDLVGNGGRYNVYSDRSY